MLISFGSLGHLLTLLPGPAAETRCCAFWRWQRVNIYTVTLRFTVLGQSQPPFHAI